MDAKINLMTINSILVQIIFNCKSLTRYPFYQYKDENNLLELWRYYFSSPLCLAWLDVAAVPRVTWQLPGLDTSWAGQPGLAFTSCRSPQQLSGQLPKLSLAWTGLTTTDTQSSQGPTSELLLCSTFLFRYFFLAFVCKSICLFSVNSVMWAVWPMIGWPGG